MGRKRRHAPLRVLLNNQLVGHFYKEPSGAITFRYDDAWLNGDYQIPVSLSLPLREDAYRGEVVSAVFENLLPDSDQIRRRVAEKVGADGVDAYSLLSVIGRDCVGALQFIPDDTDSIPDTTQIEAEPVTPKEIERILNNLSIAPLGLSRDQDFRISVAGAQEKTALLYYEGKWWKPTGTTPTTHIMKTKIGTLPNGIDLSNSIENEFYCLKMMEAFGMNVNKTQIKTFGKTKALVIERFDRKWTKDGKLLRLPQEDCCQALSVPPTRKYQSDNGPSMLDILGLLKSSDIPFEDQQTFIKAQMLFWLMGATDGHAKNFSIHLGSYGRFHLTPLYDILSAQPSLDSRQIERKQMKLAMSVGDNRHYKIGDITLRHFIQTADKANLPKSLVKNVTEEIADTSEKTIEKLGNKLPKDFPDELHQSISTAFLSRITAIRE